MSVTTTAVAPQTPVCFIDQTGIHAPTFEDILTYLVTQYQGIYGADVYLGNDSQDFQLLAVFALAIHDANSMAVAVYNAFSPATAQGVGLSSVIKINNMRRLTATNSMVDLVLIGQAFTQIINGVVRDDNQNNWLLPATVEIPASGQIIVTATAANAGAVAADRQAVHIIATPMRGWQSASNPEPAVQGDPLESDAAVRQRQRASTTLPSQSILDGMIGAVAEIPGVIRYMAYENDTNITDTNGIPGNMISFVVDGGDAQTIADAIMLKKPPGSGTYGTTTEVVQDIQGVQKNVNFFRPIMVPITVALTIQPLSNYTTTTGTAIANALAAFISQLQIGSDVFRTQLFQPIYALPGGLGVTFNVTLLAISRTGTPTTADIVIAFNEAAICTVDNIALTVLVH